MFKFSFFNSENESNKENETSSDGSMQYHSDELLWLPSEEINVNNLTFLNELLNSNDVNAIKCKGIDILHIPINFIIGTIKRNHLYSSILNAEMNHSDLLPSVYEGGLKIWECTYDLLNFIADSNLNLQDKKVLDLGCGVGILGIFCLLNGAQVFFQDYNKEVLQYVTVPNTIHNLKKDIQSETLKKSKFYSGDWKSFTEFMQNQRIKFDYIFTSETIYNTNNYEKLHVLFKECLNRNGTVYLSAKTYYFGVGGGLRSFEEYVLQENTFNFTTIWKTMCGLQREILKLEFNNGN